MENSIEYNKLLNHSENLISNWFDKGKMGCSFYFITCVACLHNINVRDLTYYVSGQKLCI